MAKKQKHEYEYPCWRYHKDHEPRLLSDESDLDSLPGGHEKWHDNPADAGVKLEVVEHQGRQHVRRVKGYDAAKEAEELEAKKKEDLSFEQGHKAEPPQEDLAEASEERLREVLISHGHPSEKLEKKSKKQLLKMLAE